MIDWTPGCTLEFVEKAVIQQAHKFYRGNVVLTAQSLGVSPRTIDTKLEKYEADDREQRLIQEKNRNDRQALLQRARGTAYQIPSSIPSAEAGPRVESALNLPPNRKCPCQSGLKFKKCCKDTLPKAVLKETAEIYKKQMKSPDLVFQTDQNKEKLNLEAQKLKGDKHEPI